MGKKIYGGLTRAKGTLDGCNTLKEAAERYRAEAAYLEQLIEDGVELAMPVDDDYAFIETTNMVAAKKYNMEEKQNHDEFGEEY